MIRDITDMIRKIVDPQIEYLRHYEAIIVGPTADPSPAYMITIPALGVTKPVVAYPRFQNGGAVRYSAGDVVDIGFLEGDRDRPVIYGSCGEYSLQVPLGAETGTSTTQILYTGPLSKKQLKHDEAIGTVTLPGGVKTAIYGEDLITAINAMISIFNAHVHVETGGTTLTPATPQSALTAALLSKVKIP